MTTEQANTYCYVFTGMSLRDFALKMLHDLNTNPEEIKEEEHYDEKTK